MPSRPLTCRAGGAVGVRPRLRCEGWKPRVCHVILLRRTNTSRLFGFSSLRDSPLLLTATRCPSRPPSSPSRVLNRPASITDLIDASSLRASVPLRWEVSPSCFHASRPAPCNSLSWLTSRLYFTSFPHPPPRPDTLNDLARDPANLPEVRGVPRGSSSTTPEDDAKYWYFTIDDQLLYLSFFQDWGPLNLAMVYKACILIHEILGVRFPASCHPRGLTRPRRC